MAISCGATDQAMMARCIELSRVAARKGEYPFGAVIALNGQIVAEAINSTIRDGDVTRHAEIIALSRAQKTAGRERLRRYTLYSNIEPCAMCAYCIREAWVSRRIGAEQREMSVNGLDRPELGVGDEPPFGLAIRRRKKHI